MVRIDLQLELNYQIDQHGADFIFNIHAAQTPNQVISNEKLFLSQSVEPYIDIDHATGNRYMRLRALQGDLKVSYSATVDVYHHFSDPAQMMESPVRSLPPEVLVYLYPSRYCQSDRLGRLASNEFGGLRQGYSRVSAIQDWVRQQVSFTSNTSNSNTSALDTLMDRVGVCRDFAHVMIALCRALSIPARMATGTDYGADVALGPPDFHAYVEVYIDNRWYIFDPSGTTIPMGCIRLGTGRDAADVAFATIFGNVLTGPPILNAVAIEDAERNMVLPYHCLNAISTAAPRHANG